MTLMRSPKPSATRRTRRPRAITRRAEQALRRALWLQEAHFGHVHPEVANTLNNLGVVCDSLGRPNEAEFLYRRALGLARTTLPAGHPYIETSLQNLKALYRTQARPEKLALVADSETSRSGLPIQGAGDDEDVDVDVDVDVDIEIDAPVPQELPADQTPAPASVAGSQLASAPLKRPDAIYDQLAQPAVLMVAAASILLLVGWWLFAGNGAEESSAPVEPPVVTRATEPPVSLQPDVAVELVAEPDDRPSPILESPSDRPPAASPDEAGVGSAVVVEARVCDQLVTRDDDGSLLGDWRCDAVAGPVDTGQLYFYTRIRSPTDITVQYRWLRDSVVQQAINLEVGANDRPGYRTYSTLTVSPERSGAWQVEVRTSDEDVLRVEDFLVRLP